MEGKQKQTKVLSCPKKKKRKIFLGHDVPIEHAGRIVLWNPEAKSGRLPHWAGIVDNLSLPFTLFLNFCFHPLLRVNPSLLSFSVPCNLTSMLQCLCLPFTSTLGPLPRSFLSVQSPPTVRRWLTVLTFFPTHWCPHTSCTLRPPLGLCWCLSLPALTQWGFPCNSVLVSVWISVILVWSANKTLKVVSAEQKAWKMVWAQRQWHLTLNSIRWLLTLHCS